MNNQKNIFINVDNFIKGYKIVVNVIRIIFLFIMCIVLFNLFFSLNDIMSKIILLPFLLCCLCFFGQLLCTLIGNVKLVKLCKRVYVFIFLMYWFCIIGLGIYSSIINKEYEMIFFTFPFIMAGIYMLTKTLGKKK